MKNQTEQHVIQGMQRDLGVSKFSKEHAFENMNLRITARDDHTLGVVTNERGNKECILIDEDSGDTINMLGIYLGSCVIGEYIIVFTKSNTDDYIYRIKRDHDFYYNTKILFAGNLNFSTSKSLDCIGIYESNDIQKVYWVDGLNQPRVINIVAPNDTIQSWTSDSFNFVNSMSLKETVDISKTYVGGGKFQSGVVQYFFTYYNLYGQETHPFYISSLYYSSAKDRGGNTDEKFSNAFDITINNIDKKFDFIRIYSVFRSSIDDSIQGKLVRDINIKNISDGVTSVSFIDNNNTGESIDYLELLYKGGEEFSASTIADKDNTLFLGNLKLLKSVVSESVRDLLKSTAVGSFVLKTDTINLGDPSENNYTYESTLNKSSKQIKHFKYLETYRFGVKLQYSTGIWSEVVYISDVKNTLRISGNELNYKNGTTPNTYKSVPMFRLTIPAATVSMLLVNGFKKIQPVVVYPTLNDCDIIAQGVVCPTVFNIGDRKDNAPWAQSSWFSRPNAPTTETFNTTYAPNSAGIPVEFRHGCPISDTRYSSAEIQSQYGGTNPLAPYDYHTTNTEYLSTYSDCFFVDQSVFTFHSPDFEFNDELKNLDLSTLKFRIVGASILTSSMGDIDITIATTKSNPKATGFFHKTQTINNLSQYAGNSLVSNLAWFDRPYSDSTFSDDSKQIGFATYPWHRNGSLSDEFIEGTSLRYGELSKKTISNLKFCYDNIYLNTPWNAERNDESRGISGAVLFDSSEKTMVKLKAPTYSGQQDYVYYGNIDKVVIPNLKRNADGYPIVTSNIDYGAVIGGVPAAAISNVEFVYNNSSYVPDLAGIRKGNDAVRLQYKSSPHVIMALNYDSPYNMNVLPTFINDSDVHINDRTATNLNPFYFNQSDSNKINVNQDYIDFLYPLAGGGGVQYRCYPKYWFYWIGELYRDNVTNKFGGDSTIDILNNIWYDCGDSIALLNDDDDVTIDYTEGDTYYQRYDHLKTYAYTSDAKNNLVEIISFMCETKVNIDGRYDRNRGMASNLNVSPTNFNLLNKVYSQNNNFITSQTLDYSKFSNDTFKNSIVWSKTKQYTEEIDKWTSITFSSIMDLDGDKGSINKLVKFNNSLFSFQDTGISKILFNERVQLQTSDNIPIEISNSDKVSGKYYIANNQGSINKDSVYVTPGGIYYIDDLNQDISVLTGDGSVSLSDNLGFRKFIGDEVTYKNWTPGGFDNFKIQYDKTQSDVYFINKNYCLVYSELLKQFISFYSYESTPSMFNLNGKFYSFKVSDDFLRLWEQNVGEYNYYFKPNELSEGKIKDDYYKPFYTTFVSNEHPQYDKIFNTIGYRSDFFELDEDNKYVLNNKTFDTLEIWNEYQYGKSQLSNNINQTSNIKQKFRVWNALLPRDDSNNLNRIRNPWAYIKLSMETPNDYKIHLHDLTVGYFV